jgi:zinc transporter 1/2/3
MNCPSRNDDDELLHPDWNQSPPRFAADLTTCADLNGIANARELQDAGRLSSDCNLGFGRGAAFDDCDDDEMEKVRLAVGEGVKGIHQGTYHSGIIYLWLLPLPTMVPTSGAKTTRKT